MNLLEMKSESDLKKQREKQLVSGHEKELERNHERWLQGQRKTQSLAWQEELNRQRIHEREMANTSYRQNERLAHVSYSYFTSRVY